MAQKKERVDTKKFVERMTALHLNPKRFQDLRFTKYFGGICICYWDTALKRYVVERVSDVTAVEVENDSESD